MFENRVTNQGILVALLFATGCMTTTIALFVAFEVRSIDTL
jgi:hypothetical protein